MPLVKFLGPTGMSDDDTDIDEIPSRERGDLLRQRKRLRRVELAWRSRDVEEVLRELDHHHREQVPLGKGAPGNPPSERILEAKSAETRRIVPRLPRNFYDQEWLSQRSSVQVNMLDITSDWLPE